jgi:glycosyltransferase involved in cell wall biosynthesis
MGKMKISIIIPVYNVERYISDCLKSVMSQTYQGELECILVDDCGTDESMTIIDKLIDQYNGAIVFKIFHQEKNGGAASARNAGMKIATGDYFFFIDSDDIITEDCLTVLSEPLTNEKYDLVIGDFRSLKNNVELPVTSMNLGLSDGTILRNTDIVKNYRKTWNMVVWNRLVKSSFIRENHLSFKEGFVFEDELWCFEVACLASSLYAVNKVTYYYVKWDNSVSANLNKSHKDWIEIVKRMGGFVKERGIYNKYIHLRINSFFIRIMNDNSSCLSQFIKVYKDMTKFLKPSKKQIFRAIGWDIRWYLMDFHYLLPERIAPYWMYYTFSKPLSYLGILKK